MKQTKILSVYQLAADEGMWLTRYTEEQDITTFSATKTVTTTKSNIKFYREITDAEYNEYEERKAIALASQQTEEEPMP